MNFSRPTQLNQHAGEAPEKGFVQLKGPEGRHTPKILNRRADALPLASVVTHSGFASGVFGHRFPASTSDGPSS